MQANIYVDVPSKKEKKFVDALDRLCKRFAKTTRKHGKKYKAYFFQFEA